MKTVNCSISEKRLKEIIREELERKHRSSNEMNAQVASNEPVNEEVDHEGAKTVVTGSSKLLKALGSFKEDANGAMASATSPHLDALVNVLEQMINNPASYTDKVKPEPKRIRLRNVGE